MSPSPVRLSNLRLPQLRWPTRHELAVGIPVLVVAVVFIVLFARNADTADFPDYEVPEGFAPAPAPTTLPPGVARPPLAVVAGTTTTVVPGNHGTAALSGVVSGPQGPVPGATVRIERAILGQVQRFDVATGGDGGWVVPGLGGGAYRVRAFLPPTLAQRTASVFFLTAGEQRSVDLSVESFAEPTVSVVVAPDPPLLDQPLNLVVQVIGRDVDVDGVVHPRAVIGAQVDVAVSGGWQRQAPTTTTTTTTTTSTTTPASSSTSTSTTSTTTTTTTTVPASSDLFTDASGQVTVPYTCSAPGPVQLSITVRVTPDAVPTVVGATVSDCIDPATTTTAPPPSTASTATTTSTGPN